MKKLSLLFSFSLLLFTFCAGAAETIAVTQANFESHRTTGNAFYRVGVDKELGL